MWLFSQQSYLYSTPTLNSLKCSCFTQPSLRKPHRLVLYRKQSAAENRSVYCDRCYACENNQHWCSIGSCKRRIKLGTPNCHWRRKAIQWYNPEIEDSSDSDDETELQEVEAASRATNSATATSTSESDSVDEVVYASAPLAAASFANLDFKELKSRFQQVYDYVYYGDALPPVGSHQLSYARFLELMADKRVKRIYLLAEGQVALVEVPAPGWATNYDTEKHERENPEIAYYNQRPEWEMDKIRYYVELPADIWDDGYFMNLLKAHQPVKPLSPEARRANLLMEDQVTPELVVMDPSRANSFVSQYVADFVPIIGLIVLRSVLGSAQFILEKFSKPKKSKMEEMAEQFTKFQGQEFNIEDKGGKKRSTGVSYRDVAGIDAIMDDIEECMKMLLGDERYIEAGAKPPRGILLEGPPGTGKTYLARAMAGEHGVPFYSANGAEFVEMFQGVAASRIRNLFKQARKRAPSIIFIDEIDAIGKRRSTGPSDSGTQEREQGLLQLLFEMDGFTMTEKVLVIGATNRVDILDDALVRPGRFDRIIYMGRPSTSNRKKILQVHARNKPIVRDEDDSLLGQVADMTVGYSGAELANLMNESAILAVRRSKAIIDLPIVLEAMEKVRLGLPQPPLPDSEAKRRFAVVQAGRAVLCAITLGMPPIERVSIVPRAGVMAQILFVPQEFGKYGDQWHSVAYAQRKINAVAPQPEPPTVFELCCGLMIPLYAARATEEVFFGKEGVTLGSSKEMSRAADLVRWLVVNSTLHPEFRDTPVLYAFQMGGHKDPTTQNMEDVFEPLMLDMLRSAHSKATSLTEEYAAAIQQVAREMLEDEHEAVTGKRLVEIIQHHAAAWEQQEQQETTDTNGAQQSRQPAAWVCGGEVSFRDGYGAGCSGQVSFDRQSDPEAVVQELLQNDDLQRAIQVVIGKRSMLDLIGPKSAATKAEQVKRQLLDSPETLERLKAVRNFANSSNGAPFPPPPSQQQYVGPDLEDWAPPQPEIIEY